MVVLDEEHEEDILRLAGVSDESSLSDSVAATSKAAFAVAGGEPGHGDLCFAGDFAVRGGD